MKRHVVAVTKQEEKERGEEIPAEDLLLTHIEYPGRYEAFEPEEAILEDAAEAEERYVPFDRYEAVPDNEYVGKAVIKRAAIPWR